MAAPSSGELSLGGLYNEVEVNSYTSTKSPGNVSLSDISDGTTTAINKAMMPYNRPNESQPHQMSEFYSYDQNNDLVGHWGDDWEDGVYASGRDDFHELGHQLYEDGDLDDAEIAVTFTYDGNPLYPSTTNVRPTWTKYHTSTTTTDWFPGTAIRMNNVTATQGSWWKASGPASYGPSGKYLPSVLTSTNQALATRYRFFMNSTNNKDHSSHFGFNTTSVPGQPALVTKTYEVRIADNADPSPGKLRIMRRNGTTNTTLGTFPGAYTMGTTKDIVVSFQETGPSTRTMKVGIGPTTVSTPEIISTYNVATVPATHPGHITLRQLSFRAPRYMSTPRTSHYHQVSQVYATVVTI